MKKILISGVVVAAAATGSSVAADEVSAPNLNQDNLAQKLDDCSCQSDTLIREKENIHELNNTIQMQELVVSEEKENLSTAENELANSLEQLESTAKKLEETTPEKISATKDKVTEIETKLANDQSVELAKSQLKDAEQKVREHQPILEMAQKDVESKLAEVQDSEAKVRSAEAAFDSKNIITAQHEVSQLESTLKQNHQNLVELNQKMEMLEKEKSAFYVNSKKKREELEKAVKEAGPEYTTELVQHVIAENKVSDSDAYSQPKDPYYISNGKKFYVSANENVEFDGEATEVIVLKNAEEYTVKEIDYEKVSQYVSEYLTKLRKINGIDIPVPPVTPEALKWAKARTDEMARNKELSHDTILKPTDFGLNSETENATTALGKKSKLSEKEIAYNQILRYFNDYSNAFSFGAKSPTEANIFNYGHRTPLLGASGTGLAMVETGGYSVLTFVSTDGKNVYEILPSNSQNTWSVFNLASAKNEDNDPLRSEFYFNGKRTKFLPKTTFKYVWEETVYHKNEKYSTAVENLKQFELESASEDKRLQEHTSLLAKNKQELEASQKVTVNKLNQSKERLNELTKGNQEKLRNLEILQKELENKQTELSSLQDTLKHEMAIHEELKANVIQAQEVVTKAEEDLKSLKAQLEQAQTELDSLQKAGDAYAKAKANFDLAQKKLTDAQEKLKQDLLVLAALKSELQQKELELAICESKENAKLEGLVYTPSSRNKSQHKSVNILKPVEQFDSTKKETIGDTISKTVNSGETLPNTGETGSYLTIAGLSLMTTLGVVSSKKRKKA
ncbi:LPXTG cell wall anchor domain-containing protein [Streptococcus sp. 121]|uniref:LPXTG cell wall anchor domain-containing protein n=1 Tax=Streptococcus sp. 121 TaxID=2797637 RepID=UPI0018F0D4ED|nr:LPXTG cell wall anchor domain-containing protein [Streptococcus sp. 121]MBJ6746518.1 LPXTG cell wall anchor domain-containing protein [Streptococcus sp. 121]